MTATPGLEKVVGLTGFGVIHVFIASLSPAQGERNQMVNAKFTRPVNAMPMSSPDITKKEGAKSDKDYPGLSLREKGILLCLDCVYYKLLNSLFSM